MKQIERESLSKKKQKPRKTWLNRKDQRKQKQN